MDGAVPYNGLLCSDIEALKTEDPELTKLTRRLPPDTPVALQKCFQLATKYMPQDRSSLDDLKTLLLEELAAFERSASKLSEEVIAVKTEEAGNTKIMNEPDSLFNTTNSNSSPRAQSMSTLTSALVDLAVSHTDVADSPTPTDATDNTSKIELEKCVKVPDIGMDHKENKDSGLDLHLVGNSIKHAPHNATQEKEMITAVCSICGTTPLGRRAPNEETICNACSTKPIKRVPHNAAQVTPTVCSNCGTTTTPVWRRTPNGETICNACGLYLKARNIVRPPWRKRASHDPINRPSSNNGDCKGTGRKALVCTNCGTTNASLWRRNDASNTICNACSLHNTHHPTTMKRRKVKRRKRDLSYYAYTETDSEAEKEDSTLISHKRKASDKIVRKPIDIDSSSISSTTLDPLANVKVPHGSASVSNLPSLAQLFPPISPSLMSTITVPGPCIEPQSIHHLISSQSVDPTTVSATHVLEARQELRREVNNLSALMTRTAAMLNKLDQTMTTVDQPITKPLVPSSLFDDDSVTLLSPLSITVIPPPPPFTGPNATDTLPRSPLTLPPLSALFSKVSNNLAHLPTPPPSATCSPSMSPMNKG